VSLFVKRLLLTFSILALSACAVHVQTPISYKAPMAAPNITVGVVVVTPEKADITFPGANCLLCVITAQAMHTSLGKHTDTLSIADLKKLNGEFKGLLEKKGYLYKDLTAALIAEKIEAVKEKKMGYAEMDYQAFAAKHGVQKLLIVRFPKVGFTRPFASYFPTSAPAALVIAQASMVSMPDQTLDWYQNMSFQEYAGKEWDEVPNFPGLTNAYYQAIENAREFLLKPFQ
jgi:hypothetical protein